MSADAASAPVLRNFLREKGFNDEVVLFCVHILALSFVVLSDWLQPFGRN